MDNKVQKKTLEDYSIGANYFRCNFLPKKLITFFKSKIKHKDGNKFNNNCENLEWADDFYKEVDTDRDYKESITIKSKQKGVYYLEKQNKWVARLMKNTISYSKVFSNEEDAILYRVGLENAHFIGRKGKEKGTKLHVLNTSGHRGVSWSKRDKKWQAKIGVGNKTVYLGSFAKERTAAFAYNLAAKNISKILLY